MAETLHTPTQKKESNGFFREAVQLLNESGHPYMLGGAFAMFHYTGIFRDTKDLDVFCKSADLPAILSFFAAKGFKTELTDSRWLAKVYKDPYFIDIIFDSVSNTCTVDDLWFERSSTGLFLDFPVRFISAEELIWCKMYVQNRERNDSADINHTWLKWGKQLDWAYLLQRLDRHWHLLLAQILKFQFVYPADYRDIIPKWLFDELMHRAEEQYELPPPVEKTCLGPLIDQTQYEVDIVEWKYKVFTIKTI